MLTLTAFETFSAMVGSLPVVVLGIQEVADILAKAISHDPIVTTPDFDMAELTDETGARFYLIQGSITGESVMVRKGAC